MTSVSFAKETVYQATFAKTQGQCMWIEMIAFLFRYSMSLVWKCRFFTPKSFNSWLYVSTSDPLTVRKHQMHVWRKSLSRLLVQVCRCRIYPNEEMRALSSLSRLGDEKEEEREPDKRFIVSLERQLIAIANWNWKPLSGWGRWSSTWRRRRILKRRKRMQIDSVGSVALPLLARVAGWCCDDYNILSQFEGAREFLVLTSTWEGHAAESGEREKRKREKDK